MIYITVDTDGVSGDYASLALAIAALISGGSFTDDVTITCYATTSVADTTNFDMSGLDTTSSYTLYITAGDSNYNLSFDLATLGVSTAIIYSDTTNTLNLDFFGIIIDTNGIDANYEGTFYFNHAYGDIKIRKNNITESNSTFRARTIRIGCDSATYGGSYAIKDNIIDISGAESTDSRNAWLSLGSTPDLLCYNNTIIGNATGTPVAYRDEGGTGDDAATFINNLFYDIDTPGLTPATHSYNLSNLSWNWGGTGEVGSVTFTFVGGGDYHLDSSDTGARGQGIGPSSDANVETTDIDGDTRSGTTCDVGADEYVSGEVNNPTILFISDSILTALKSNIVITGNNFGDVSGTLKVSSQIDGSGTISYQTVNNWTSGSIDFDPVKGSVSFGNNYILVVDNSNRSSNGLPIFFTGSESTPTKIGVLGGAGDKSGASDNNGGAYVSGESTLNTMQGNNGDPLYSVNDCNYDSSSGVIFKTGSFASGLVGNYVNILSGGTGTLENKRYYIQNSHPDWLLIGTGYTNNTINVIVGGALKTYEKTFSSGVLSNGDTLYRTYGNESYQMENGNTITLDGASGGRPEIGGGLINYV